MCTLWWFDIPTHCERIPTVQLINTPISLNVSLFFLFVRRKHLSCTLLAVSVLHYSAINQRHRVYIYIHLKADLAEF